MLKLKDVTAKIRSLKTRHYCDDWPHDAWTDQMLSRGVTRIWIPMQTYVILASEYSVISYQKLWPPSLILMAAEGW